MITGRPQIIIHESMAAPRAGLPVDEELIQASMIHGGIRLEDIPKYSVIIKATEDLHRKGGAFYKHPDHHDTPAMEVYSYRGTGAISAGTVAHEARHLADAAYIGESAFVLGPAKRRRKIAATAGAILLSPLYAKTIGIDVLHNPINPLAILEQLAVTDVFACQALRFEYISRKQERRANLSMIGAKGNILPGTKRAKAPLSKLAKTIFKTAFIPNFKL